MTKTVHKTLPGGGGVMGVGVQGVVEKTYPNLPNHGKSMFGMYVNLILMFEK